MARDVTATAQEAPRAEPKVSHATTKLDNATLAALVAQGEREADSHRQIFTTNGAVQALFEDEWKPPEHQLYHSNYDILLSSWKGEDEEDVESDSEDVVPTSVIEFGGGTG